MWKAFLLPFTLIVMLAVGKCEMTCPAFNSGTATSVSNNFYTITRDSEGYVQLDAEFSSVEELQAAMKALEDSEQIKQIINGECHNEVSTTITVKEGTPPLPTTTANDVKTTATSVAPETSISVTSQKNDVKTTATSVAPETLKSVTSQTSQTSTSTPAVDYDDTSATTTTEDALSTTASTTAETSDATSTVLQTTAPPTLTAEDTTTGEKTTPMTPGPCEPPKIENSWNFTYDGKCFFLLWTPSKNQDVTYSNARKMCESNSFQLGNYSVLLLPEIKEYIFQNIAEIKVNTFWTVESKDECQSIQINTRIPAIEHLSSRNNDCQYDGVVCINET